MLVIWISPCKGGFTRQSNAGDGYLQPANDGGNLQHQLVRSAYLKMAHVAFLPAKTVGSNFTGHRILTTTPKNRNAFFCCCCHNNYCFRQNFRTILNLHRHAFSWLLAPESNDGKIITFLPSTCEWSRYRSLHVLGRLLVVITSFWLSCEAAFIKIVPQICFSSVWLVAAFPIVWLVAAFILLKGMAALANQFISKQLILYRSTIFFQFRFLDNLLFSN